MVSLIARGSLSITSLSALVQDGDVWPRQVAGRPAWFTPTPLGNVPCRLPKTLTVEAMAKSKGGANKKPGSLIPKTKPEEPAAQKPVANPYESPDVFMHSLLLLDSFHRATGATMFESGAVELVDAARLVRDAPFACISAGVEEPPLVDYANVRTLDMFEAGWEQLPMPTAQLSAELFEGKAVSVTSPSGKKFKLDQVTAWDITNLDGKKLGRAVVARDCYYVDDAGERLAPATTEPAPAVAS
eukprot:jgi/Mesvir1/23200/Mv22664-RA.1